MTSADAKRVLIVEDDRAVRDLLRKALSKKYTVVVADDGPSGLVLAKKFRPHLFIFDVMMPGMDGFDLASKVREEPEFKKVPLVFLTARDTAQDTIKGIQVGARHYITKPFSVMDVVERVEKILGD